MFMETRQTVFRRWNMEQSIPSDLSQGPLNLGSRRRNKYITPDKVILNTQYTVPQSTVHSTLTPDLNMILKYFFFFLAFFGVK